MQFSIEFACLLTIFGVLTQNAVVGIPESRIVSGSPAVLGQFPWQVILKRDDFDDLLCGGSIISVSMVLTAAHCTYGLDSIYMLFGTVHLYDDKALSMTSTQFFIHPNYNPDNLNNDVSMIALPKSLTYTSNIQPITMVSASQTDTFLGATCTIVGFGLMDDENLDYPEVLQHATVTIINNNACTPVFGDEVVISSTLCAQGANSSNMSICSGDSGGPLITKGPNGNYIQIGINSFVARDRCTEGYPSGYARLTSFLSYIAETQSLLTSSEISTSTSSTSNTTL